MYGVELQPGPRATLGAGSALLPSRPAETSSAAQVFAARRRRLAIGAGRYALAAASVGAVLGIKLALIPWLEHDTPFLLFFAAVLVAGWYGGVGAGGVGAGAGTPGRAPFFMGPHPPPRGGGPGPPGGRRGVTPPGVFI